MCIKSFIQKYSMIEVLHVFEQLWIFKTNLIINQFVNWLYARIPVNSFSKQCYACM